MESFFLSETTKYLYLLFDPDNFIHNTGQYGTIIDTPNGECVIDAGGYIFNTEAHPIDPAALHCCHAASNKDIIDFKELQKNKALFRGESIKEKQIQAKQSYQKNTQSEDDIVDDLEIVTTELNNSYAKLEDNDNISQKINDDKLDLKENSSFPLETESTSTSNVITQMFSDKKKAFDPQVLLERLRSESKMYNVSMQSENYRLLTCRAQAYLQRVSILGEVFSN